MELALYRLLMLLLSSLNDRLSSKLASWIDKYTFELPRKRASVMFRQ